MTLSLPNEEKNRWQVNRSEPTKFGFFGTGYLSVV